LQQLPPPPPAPQSQPAQPLPGAAAAQPAPYGYPQRPYYGPAQGAHFYPQQPPATIPYVEGRKPPPGYREETGIRRGYVIAGAVLFGSAYLSSVFAAQLMTSSESYEYDNSSRRRDTEALPLLIPAIGPFISLATLDPDLHGTGWLVLDGFTQMAGVAMFVVGMTTGAKKWVRDEGHAVQVRLTPFRTASHTGLGMVGQF
jgi:hypothetical protein